VLEYFLTPAKSRELVPTVDFNGKWNNQHGSEMTLHVQQGGVSGKYRTGVGAPKPTEEFDVTGFCAGDVIAFTVNFGKYGSLTAWVGQVAGEPPNEILQTLWHLARNIQEQEEPDQLWEGVLAGADTFVRGQHKSR
jgi:hypothetical protein